MLFSVLNFRKIQNFQKNNFFYCKTCTIMRAIEFNEQYPNLINKGYFTDVDDDTMRLGTFYYAGGIYYILRQWLTEPINKTPQEVAVLMYHFLNVD